MAEISEKVGRLFGEVGRACKKSGRSLADVTVVAATKYAEASVINAAISAGIDIIGENKVKEAARKFPAILSVTKHFIGHLQTNKVKEAVNLFDLISSVDSYRLAEMINIEAERALKRMPVYIEVNIAKDPSKHGLDEKEVKHFLHKILPLTHLDVRGLMTIVPLSHDPEDARPYFKRMKKLFDEMHTIWSRISVLSMGMTEDFRIAIEEGATEVRIGSYLFK